MRNLIAFALLFPMIVFAKDPPLPEALLNAKTAFVEIVGTAEESFDKNCTAAKANSAAKDKNLDKQCKSLKREMKADKQLFDNYCKELNKWGRFTLVQDRSRADIRILLRRTEKITVTRSVSTVNIPVATSPNPENQKVEVPRIGTANSVYDGGRYYATVNGQTVAISNPAPDPRERMQKVQNVSETSSSRVEYAIYITAERNNFLLYLDKTGASGKLVSHLKKKMERK